jgi:RNA polymerase sigma-70 factor (ECF subfamily)
MKTDAARDVGAPRSDEALAAAAQRGDHDAYRELVERYQPMAFACAVAHLGDRDLAEDVVQEAFVRAYGALDRFRTTGCWGAWMMQIVRNACRDALRRRLVRRDVPLDPRIADARPDPMERLIDQERQDAVRRAVEALPEKFRVPVRMHFGSQMTYRQIAIALGLKESTVVGRIAGALRLLRRRMGAETI